MHERLYESDHQVDRPDIETPAASRSRGQDRLGNAAMLERVGLDKTPGDGEGDPAGEAETGPAEVSHGGSTPMGPPSDGASSAPLPSGEELIAPIQPPAEEIAVVRPEIAPACDYTQWVPGSCSPDMGGMGGMGGMGMGDMGMGMGMGLGMGDMGMGDMGGQFEMPSVGTGAQQVATMSEEEFAAYEQQTNDLVNATIVNMSTEEKRSTLAEFGYSGETIGTMDETMMNQALAGTLCKTIRAYRIQGMTPEELDRLPAKEQRQFLTDLGVPAKDLWKAKDRHIRQAVKDVVAVAKTPGHHKVKLKIRGGWFRSKSYDINMQVDDEGHLADVDIEKKGGLFSKIGGLIKMAMPYIAKLLAGVTGGLSLLAYGIYKAVEAARTGDWLAGIQMVAGAFVGAGFDTIGDIIGRVGSIAGAAVKGFQAIKSRNLGGLIDAFATGAEGVAGFAKDQLGGFAKTCQKWADAARTWGGVAVAGVGVFQAIKGKDPLAAIASSLDLVVSLRDHGNRDDEGPPTSSSNNPGVLVTSARLFGHAVNARDAATGDPPRWGAFAASIFEMAGEYTDSGKVDTGRDLALHTQNFDTAYRNGDWSAAGQAILDISETIDLAHRGDISDDEREQVTGRYDTAGTIIIPGLETVENIQTGNWTGALANGLATAMSAELARAEDGDKARIEEKYKTAKRYLSPSVECANAMAAGDWSRVATYGSILAGELSSNGAVDKGANIGRLAGTLITEAESGNADGVKATAKELWEALKDLWGDAPTDTKSVEASPTLPAGVTAAASPAAGTNVRPGASAPPRREGPAGNPDAMKRALAWSLIEAHPHGIQLDSSGEQIADYGAATATDCEAVLNEMVKIPLGGIQVVHCRQTKVTVCHNNITVARPDMIPTSEDDKEPRNHGEGSSWMTVPGIYIPADNQVVVCAQDGQVSTEHGSDNLVVHEVSHAIDRTIKGEWDLKFLVARANDWDNLTEYEKFANGGAQESYAESMARFYGKARDPRDERLYPHLFAYWESVPLKPLW